MLVLTVKEGKRIHIGDNIVIEVERIFHGNRVALGIQAPKDVPIYRKELKDRIEQEREQERGER